MARPKAVKSAAEKAQKKTSKKSSKVASKKTTRAKKVKSDVPTVSKAPIKHLAKRITDKSISTDAVLKLEGFIYGLCDSLAVSASNERSEQGGKTKKFQISKENATNAAEKVCGELGDIVDAADTCNKRKAEGKMPRAKRNSDGNVVLKCFTLNKSQIKKRLLHSCDKDKFSMSVDVVAIMHQAVEIVVLDIVAAAAIIAGKRKTIKGDDVAAAVDVCKLMGKHPGVLEL